MPSRKLKRGAHVTDHDPKVALRDRKLVIASLAEALTDGDAQAFKEILAAHLEVVQKESFYAEAGLSRRTLYRMLAPSGNPTLENIARVVKAIAKSAA
jgi:probable addiction module antidote protein